MSAAKIATELKRTRYSAVGVNAPPAPGLYAIYMRSESDASGIPSGDDGLLYVGSSSNLATRKLSTHFQSGESGFSTLRRTLGAILKNELELKAIPRAQGKSRSNTTNYKFLDDGEERLTMWMLKHLDVAFAVDEHYETSEPSVIAELKPPLNLTYWENPQRRYFMALRKLCADEARTM